MHKHIIKYFSIYIFSISSIYMHNIYSIKNNNKVKKDMLIDILQKI